MSSSDTIPAGWRLLRSGPSVPRRQAVAEYSTGGSVVLRPETGEDAPYVVRRVRLIVTLLGSGTASRGSLAFSDRLDAAADEQFQVWPATLLELFVPGTEHLCVAADGTGLYWMALVDRWLTSERVGL